MAHPLREAHCDERRGNFTSWSEQKKAAEDLARRFATHRLTVAFPSDGYFQDASRFYKIILGPIVCLQGI
jgi:hypothetical protein